MKLQVRCILLVAVTLNPLNALQSGPYNLIFNCDGYAVLHDANKSYSKWISNIFDPLVDSDCDVIFWNDGAGGNTANYKSDILDLTDYNSSENMYYVKEMINQGIDPPEEVINEANKRSIDIFYSYRVNDIHDSFIKSEYPKFKDSNPHWLIGESNYSGFINFPSSLNFGVLEVVNLKKKIISEIIDNYKFDGIELDLMRGPPYFKFDEIETKKHMLTDLVRYISKKCKNRGMKLAVRVGESLESCRLDGFEVELWLEEDLLDILVLGSGVIDVKVSEFVHLAEGTNVSIYPCIYGWPSKYYPIPENISNAVAMNFWSQGASGMYIYNWFLHSPTSQRNSKHMAQSIKQFGSSEKVFENFIEFCFAADRGGPSREYPNNWLNSKLPHNLSDDNSLELEIPIHFNFNRFDDVSVDVELSKQPINEISLSINNSPFQILTFKDNKPKLALSSLELVNGPNTLKFLSTLAEETLIKKVEVNISRRNNFSASGRTNRLGILSENWFRNESIGYFYQTNKKWIYSLDHGWLYPHILSGSTCWFFSFKHGWFFLDQQSFANHGLYFLNSSKTWGTITN